MTDYKKGDWVILDMDIVQIQNLEGTCSVTAGSFNVSGNFSHRFRPLTPENKALMEYFAWQYKQLDDLPGWNGLNYPDISEHLSRLSCQAIDDYQNRHIYMDQADDFINDVKDLVNKDVKVQGIPIFRSK